MILAHPAVICCHVASTRFSHTRDKQASGASTSLRASSVVNIAEDGTEFAIVACYNNKFPADKAYAMAKEAVEKGVGN